MTMPKERVLYKAMIEQRKMFNYLWLLCYNCGVYGQPLGPFSSCYTTKPLQLSSIYSAVWSISALV